MRLFSLRMPRPESRGEFKQFVGSCMKKYCSAVLLSAAVLGVAAEENLALKKPVTASSVERKTLEPELAVDGNLKTRWSSQFNDPQWFMVDLGRVRKVGRVVIHWEKAFGKRYKIQLSSDQKHWKDVLLKENGIGGKETLTFPQQEARYVRFAGDSRGSWNGYSFWEFQVFEK